MLGNRDTPIQYLPQWELASRWLLYAYTKLSMAMAASLLSEIGGSSCCSLSDIKKSATASVDNLVLMTVPAYKPDFGWIFDLSDAITMSIYPAFLPLLGCQSVAVYGVRTSRVPRVLFCCSSLHSMSTFHTQIHQTYVM
jgi:hypothetical protein